MSGTRTPPTSPLTCCVGLALAVLVSERMAWAGEPKKSVSDEDVAAGLLGRGPGRAAERPRVTLRAAHTRELIPVFADGLTPEVLSDFLRCRLTDQGVAVPMALLETIVEAASHFGSDRAVIISGYRSRKLNELLRKKGRNVAQESQHLRGRAVDFRLRGVRGRALGRWARPHHRGGVGVYPRSGFIHIDTGRPRTWRGR